MTKPDDIEQQDWDTAQKWMEDGFFYDPAYPEDEMTCLRRTIARAIQAARLQERDECAKVAENCTIKDDYVAEIAAAIRARK